MVKVNNIGIAALFLLGGGSLVFAQNQDTIRKEKNLDAVVIKGNVKKNSENNIISLQKKSVEVIERVGTEQLAKQSVGDVSVAVTKATGTQRQEESGEIFIRGLGDRNNSTTMNGLPIPSDDPITKNLNLGLIKTGLIDFLSIEKIYDVKNWGDVSGANVDIGSKSFVGKPYLKIGVGSSVNMNAYRDDNFYLGNGAGFWGYKELVKPTNQSVLNSGYVFRPGWDNQIINNPHNSSMELEGGTRINVGSEGKINIFAYGGFDNSYNSAESIRRSVDAGSGDLQNLTGFKNEYGTVTSGLFSVGYKINGRNEIKLASNYIHTSDQELEMYKGYIRDVNENKDEADAHIRRSLNKINNLLINQLDGNHKIGDAWEVDWTLGFNLLNSQRPDRQQNTVVQDRASRVAYFASSNPGGNHRYYDELKENEYNGDVNVGYKFSDRVKLKVGYQGRYRTDDFSAIQYNFRPNVGNAGTYFVDPTNFNSFFNANNYASNLFSIWTFRGPVTDASSLAPQTYNSTIMNHAGYGKVDYKVTDKLYAQVGLRFDMLTQELKFNTAINEGKVNKDYQKILPALNLKYEMDSKSNLRFAASKTYTTPLIIETAPFEYEDVDISTIGNADVYPADNFNVDVKYERFFGSGELVSIAAFGKMIKNPIARTTINSSVNSISYVNSGEQGTVMGVEIEVRKDILKVNNSRLYTFLNGSFIETKQDLSDEKVAKENKMITVDFNTTSDSMQGASRYIANANLGYEYKWGDKKSADFILSYNYMSDNIYAYGYQRKGNLIDKGFGTLDATLRFSLGQGVAIKFSGKNLLNPEIERVQRNETGDILVRQKTAGIQLGGGVSYTF